MSASLRICVSVHNRLKLAGLCIPTIRAGMAKDDALIIHDDGSDEGLYGDDVFKVLKDATGVTMSRPRIGIDAVRRQQILEFWGNREIHGHSHLALIDSDVIAHPSWREIALSLQDDHGGVPVCLYRTQTHEDYKNNVFRNDEAENVLWQRFAPGVFYLLTLAHCEKLAVMMPERIAWDWWVPGILGYRMAVSRTSYVDHIGWGGMHDPQDGSVGPEMAKNPTPWLVEKRKDIIAALCRPTS